MRISFVFAVLLILTSPGRAASILFVGNSFTLGELSPVKHYQPESVHDLNNEGIGGVPALFKAFTVETHLDYDVSLETSPAIHSVIPVGQAWNRAIASQIAAPNPYEAAPKGEIDLWAPDHHHGSTYGYYLEALVIFGNVTGRDPRMLGSHEQAAEALKITSALAMKLQQIAAETLAADHRDTEN